MPPKARYNDKARAGGLAKSQAIRDARKHGRKLPQGEEPKSKRQKRLDKYVDAKLRTDEKVRLIEKLALQPKTVGLSSTKVMKRTKGQEKKQIFDTFNGFEEDASHDEGMESNSDDSESYLETSTTNNIISTSSSVGANTTNTNSSGSIPFGFDLGFARDVEQAPRKSRKQPLKYNWRAKLEEEKRRKAGIVSESETTSQDEAEQGSAAENSSGDDHQDSEEEDEDEDNDRETRIQQKRESFKTWAAEQTGSLTAQSGSLSNLRDPATETYVPRPRSKSPEVLDTSNLKAPTLKSILIRRAPEIEEARAELPAYALEQEIVEKIKTHSAVIISGATGSGKTTQIPQFLYEAGFKGIGITQPRRVAAVSMARRVATEMGSESSVVAYQIRFESSVKQNTQIKFMTDGVLLRELSIDFRLSKYEVLIIDEAHERTINTDILLGVLSRVCRLRENSEKPLRLVIMSATLRVSDFAENKRLFASPPPILSIEARQYPVGIHFSKRTEMSSYVEEAFKKVCKIHEKLPPGGVLVFLTGQQEILQCSKLLREHFGKKVLQGDGAVSAPVKLRPQELAMETEDYDTSVYATRNKDDRDGSMKDDYDEDSDLSDIEETPEDVAMSAESKEQKFVQILPLYSLLPTTEQMKVFKPAVAQCRQIILATNVAETSLTIPGIRYVVDSGRAKVRRFDGRVQSFEIDWISKASADQRAGRAGRTGPGHTYRLFSSAVYDASFPQFSEAEILSSPIDGVVLQMKSMNIPKIVNFPFPTPPDRTALAAAEKLLAVLGALDSHGQITELGTQMSLFPVSPRQAKMIVMANQQGLLPYVIALVSAMSVEDPFIRPEALHDNDGANNSEEEEGNLSEERKRTRQAYYRVMSKFSSLDPESDSMRVLMAVCASDYAKQLTQFCAEHFLRHKAMDEIRKLRYQLSSLIHSITNIKLPNELKLVPPSSEQVNLIHKIMASAFLDQICIRADLIGNEVLKRGNLLNIPYVPLAPLDNGQEYVFVHPACFNARRSSASDPPEYFLYSNLSSSPNNPDKTRMKVLTPLKGSWISEVAAGTPLLTYGKPLISNITQVELYAEGRRRYVPVIPTLQLNGSGRQGWTLPAVKISQKLVNTRWVNE